MQINKLQVGIIAGVVVLATLAVLIFTGILPGLKSGQGESANLTMWGFADEAALKDIAAKYSESHQGFSLNYVKKDPVSFEDDFLNALARGGADVPDIVVFPSDYLKKHGDKLSAAPPIMVAEREIRQNFIEAGSVFLTQKNAVLGIPLYADPLILYWNGDIFSKNFVTLPPATWDDFLADAAKFTQKDDSGNIIISGAAMGRAANIKNAPLVLTALFLQGGEKIIDENGEIVLGNNLTVGNVSLSPAESALNFFTDFANPQKTSRSWSGALPEAENMFIAGKLAMYLGKISEYNDIRSKNPHLNFSAAVLPQLAAAGQPATSGSLFALSVPKASAKQAEAWDFITFVANPQNSAAFAESLGTVSLRRDVIPSYQTEAVRSVFAQSALYLKLWPNPDPEKVEEIFKGLIEDAASGQITARDALEKAKAKLSQI